MDGNAKYGTCIFMTGNDFDINSYGRNGKGYARRMDEAGCYFHPNP